MIVTKEKLETRRAQPNVGLTKKQRALLDKQRKATMADQARVEGEVNKEFKAAGQKLRVSGSTRPGKKPDAVCRDLRPKGGYFTKGQKSGALTKV